MQLILKFALACAPVIALVNVFGGVIAGIWLALKGDWWALGYGLLGVLVSHYIISFLLMPSFLIASIGIAAVQRGKLWLTRLLLGGAGLYVTALMWAWCVFTTAFFLKHARNAPVFPVLLWAYGVSTGPWTFLASKDQTSGGGNEFSIIAVLFLQLGYIAGAIFLLIMPDTPQYFIIALTAALLFAWAIQQAIAQEGLRAEASGLSL